MTLSARARRIQTRIDVIRKSPVWRLLMTQRRWVIAMAVLTALSGAVGLAAAKAMRDVIDEGVVDRSAPLRELVGSLVFLVTLRSLIGIGTRQVAARVGYQLEFDLRAWVHARVHSGDPTRMDSFATGQLVTRSMADLRIVERLVIALPRLLSQMPIMVALIGFLTFVNPLMAALTMLPLPFNWLVIRGARDRINTLAWTTLDRQARVTTIVDEAVRGIRVVKAFGQEERERAKVKAAALGAYQAVMTLVRLMARYDLVLRAAPIAARVLLLVVGARVVMSGGVTIGEMFIFFLVSATFIRLAQSLDEIVVLAAYGRSGNHRIGELLLAPGGAPASPTGGIHDLPDVRTGFVLTDALPSGGALREPVPDLTILPGTLAVLFGRGDAARSAAASAASGRTPLVRGSAVLDGTPLAQMDHAALRREVRLIVEEPFLFARSVRENLAVGLQPGAVSDDELHGAIAAAGADDVLADLPNGLDTVLGDRGLTLSGGQRQRLALARALVRPPRLLVLVDALSAVNPRLELEILRRVRAHAPLTGILCVSRRRGPELIADVVIDLREATEDRRPEDDALDGSSAHGAMSAPVAGDLSAEVPPVDDRDATESWQHPTIRNVLAPLRVPMAVATLVLLFLTAVGLVPEYLFGKVTDAIEAGDVETADRISLVLLAMAVPAAGLAYGFRIYAKKIDQGLMYLLRRRTFQRLSRLGIDYYDRELPGYVAARVVHDLDVISKFVDTGVYRLVTALAMFALATAAMVLLAPSLAGLTVAFGIIVAIATIVQVPVADRAFARVRVALGEVVARLQEDYAGRHVIAGFGAEKDAARGFVEQAWRLRQARRRATTVVNVYVELVDWIGAVAGALIFLRAGDLVLSGALTVGTVLTLRLYLDQAVIQPIPELGDVWQDYLEARVSFRQLAQPYRAPVLPVDRAGAEACPSVAGDLRFDSVTFAYPGTARTVLDGLSMQVEPGEIAAIVGDTGAGKSSIGKLLGRVYDPDAGTISIDGVDIRSYTLASYRSVVGVVPQDAFLFAGTVRSNLVYGCPETSDEAINAALEEAGVSTIVAAIPRGLDAPVREEGRNLSAAQRQALAVGRAWLTCPDILVLDEATASLDPDVEAALLDAVRRLRRTTILITHREVTARAADRIIVVARGQIVEQGRPAELCGAGSAYDSLWAVVGTAPLRRRSRREPVRADVR